MFFFGILYLFIHRGKVPFVKGGHWYANMEDVFSCKMRDMCRLEGGGRVKIVLANKIGIQSVKESMR